MLQMCDQVHSTWTTDIHVGQRTGHATSQARPLEQGGDGPKAPAHIT
jgi:hypothetical protein